VRVEPLSDDPDRFAAGAIMYREGGRARLVVEGAQADGPGLLVRFVQVRTREAAERLRDVYLEAEAPAHGPGPEAFYWHELIGVPVRTSAGEALGSVADIFRTGGGEVYVVRGGPRGEVLVPAVRSVVRRFEPRDGIIEVDTETLGLEELRPKRPRGRRSRRAAAAGVGIGEPGQPGTAGDGEHSDAKNSDGDGSGGAAGDEPAGPSGRARGDEDEPRASGSPEGRPAATAPRTHGAAGA
jgi:16S rRNA processing protein RimM